MGPYTSSSGSKSKGALRLIGAFKLCKATLLVLLALGVLRALHGGIADTVHELARVLRVDPHGDFMNGMIAKISGVSQERLRLLGFGTLVYAALFTVEGVGLLLGKVWAEWLTVVSTSGFIPLEIMMLVRHVTWTHVATLVVNLLVVAYLLHERLGHRKEKKDTRPDRSSWATSSPRASQV